MGQSLDGVLEVLIGLVLDEEFEGRHRATVLLRRAEPAMEFVLVVALPGLA